MLPLAAGSVDRLALMLPVLAAAVVVLLWLRARPVTALVLWCLVVGFVPVWFGATVLFYFAPATLVGVLVLASLPRTIPHPLSWVDLGVLAFFLVCLAPAVIGLGTLTSVATVLTQWMVAYLVGRLFAARIGIGRAYTCVGAVFAAVGAFSLVEFVLSWNPYVDLARPNGLYARWGGLQERGGIFRAEWAFGHSIALGACLALAIPLALAAPVRVQLRVAMVLTMLGGAIVSFSRIGMISSVLGVLLSIVFLRKEMPRKVRATIAVGLVGVAVIAIPIISRTFAAAGDEAAGSAAYRGDLVSLISGISVMGFTDTAQRTATGELYFGNFQSIDNALILLGLTYGWLALGLAVVLLGAAGWTVVRRRTTPATIAIVAQIPALATVALITQYGMFFWFVAGLAVSHQVTLRAAAADEATSGTPDAPDDHRLWQNVSGADRIR